jgi:rhodanese-related sulfurtransferase
VQGWVGRLLACAVLVATLLLAACGGGGQADAPRDAGNPGSASSQDVASGASADSGAVGERITVSGGSFARVSPTELREMMRQEDIVLVNTHVPFEGDIPGTDLSIPYDKIGRNLDRLPGKDAKIVLYCRSGSMSAEAAETLVGLGYDDVWDLGGGMIAWKETGFSLEGV